MLQLPSSGVRIVEAEDMLVGMRSMPTVLLVLMCFVERGSSKEDVSNGWMTGPRVELSLVSDLRPAQLDVELEWSPISRSSCLATAVSAVSMLFGK